MITIKHMAQALSRFNWKYLSVACFADDVVEIAHAGRGLMTDDEPTPMETVRPGVIRYEHEGRTCTLQMRKPGIVELFQGEVEPLPDIQPYTTLCVERARKEKGLPDTPIFALLKRTAQPKIGENRCFVLQREGDEWEAYAEGLVPWIKTALWPEQTEGPAPQSPTKSECPGLCEDFARSCLLLLVEMGVGVISAPGERTIIVPVTLTEDAKTAIEATLIGIDKILGEGAVEKHLGRGRKEELSS